MALFETINNPDVELLYRIKAVLLVREIEYCFARDYDRDDSVIDREFSALVSTAIWLESATLADLIEVHGDSTIKSIAHRLNGFE